MRRTMPLLLVLLIPLLISAKASATDNSAPKAMLLDDSAHPLQNGLSVTPLDPPSEGFESGDFSSYPWINDADFPWTVQSEQVYSGNFAARSGVVGPFGRSDLKVTLNIASPGYISFVERTSSQSQWDFLQFYIDGVLIFQWSGDWYWTQHSYAVGSGSHTFLWRYQKQVMTSTNSDCAWIDNISFPASASFFAAPRNLAASADDGLVSLSWQAPAFGTPTGYKIFRNGALLTTVTDLGYTDGSVVNETVYSYYVTAVYDGGESLASNLVHALPTVFEESFAIIGTETSSNETTAAGPINVSYQSLHGQAVYTAAELIAAGITEDCYITRIGFNVTGLPTLAMPYFVVRMGHTSASNAESWISSGLTQVLHIPSYLPSSTGWNMLTLDTPFIWNGTSNLLIDTAFGDIGSSYPSGTTQYTSVNNGYRYVRNDSSAQTTVFSGGSTSTQRPNLRLAHFTYASGPIIEVYPTSLSYGDVAVGMISTRQFSIQNSGDETLTGTITAPDGYTVALAAREAGLEVFSPSNRNALPFSVGAGQTGTFDLSFAPGSEGTYNGDLEIFSNAANYPMLNLAVSGNAYLPPVISLSTQQLSKSLQTDETGSESFLISNTGVQTLDFEMQLVELRHLNSQINSADDRNISGSTLVLDTDSYEAGTTVNWTFTLTNHSPDWEWLEDIYITFPTGVTVNSSTSFVGNDIGNIAPVFSSGDGITIHWDGSSNDYEVIFPNETAVATVNVSISPSFAGILNLPFQINGDGFNAAPHTLTGTIALSQDAVALPWLDLNPFAGSLDPGGSASIAATFNAAGLTTGDYLASILVNSNDPVHPQISVSVLLVVNSLETPVVTISTVGPIVVLDWQDVPDAMYYRVFASSDPYDGYVQIGGADQSHFELPLTAAKAFYKVTAVHNPPTK